MQVLCYLKGSTIHRTTTDRRYTIKYNNFLFVSFFTFTWTPLRNETITVRPVTHLNSHCLGCSHSPHSQSKIINILIIAIVLVWFWLLSFGRKMHTQNFVVASAPLFTRAPNGCFNYISRKDCFHKMCPCNHVQPVIIFFCLCETHVEIFDTVSYVCSTFYFFDDKDESVSFEYSSVKMFDVWKPPR